MRMIWVPDVIYLRLGTLEAGVINAKLHRCLCLLQRRHDGFFSSHYSQIQASVSKRFIVTVAVLSSEDFSDGRHLKHPVLVFL